jgi:hypothetical protein
MSFSTPPAQAPTAADLLADPVVQVAMQEAWTDSLAGDPVSRHEEGGWIYMDTTGGQLSMRSRVPGVRQEN